MKQLLAILFVLFFFVVGLVTFAASVTFLMAVKLVAYAVGMACVGGVVIGTFAYCIIMCGVKYDEWQKDKYLKKYSK